MQNLYLQQSILHCICHINIPACNTDTAIINTDTIIVTLTNSV